MTKRKFYRTTFMITVLSKKKLPKDIDVEDLAYQVGDGPCVGGDLKQTSPKKLDGKQAARLLSEMGSDASFFDLTSGGDNAKE